MDILCLFLNDSLLFGIMFIRSVTLLLKMFNCQKYDDEKAYVHKLESLECGKAPRIVCCCLRVIVLMLMTIGIRARSYKVA